MAHTRLRVAAGTAGVMVAVLSVQFLLGMGVNLTVNVAHIGFAMGSMMALMQGKPLLMIHMMLGMLTAVVALVAAVSAGVSGRASMAVSGVVGLLAVLVAGYGGIPFLFSGSNAASFTMAVGFIVAYAAFFNELVVLVRLRSWDSRRNDAVPAGGAHLGRDVASEPGAAGVGRSS